MGFHHFLHLIDNGHMFFTGRDNDCLNQTLHASPTGRAPYLLVDCNNIALPNGFGSIFAHEYSAQYWAAVMNSGYKIRIIRDGPHNATRALVKLNRMKQRLSNSIANASASKKILNSFTAESSATNVSLAVKDITIDTHRRNGVDVETIHAEQEADVLIRQLCIDLVANGEEVVVFSNDASLIVGVPDTVKLFCPRRCTLVHSDHVNGSLLKGPLVPIHLALRSLNNFLFTKFPNLGDFHNKYGCKLSEWSLVLISALLWGEDLREWVQKDKDPFQLIVFMNSFLSSYNLTENKPLVNLISASALVLTWQFYVAKNKRYHILTEDEYVIPELQDSAEGIVKEVLRVARAVLRNSQGKLFGMLPKIGERRMYHPAHNTTNLVGTETKRVIVKRIYESLNEIDGHNQLTSTLYKGRWGAWADIEPLDIDTEKLVAPLRSLSTEYCHIRKCREQAEVLTQENANSEASSDPTCISVSAVDFNKWISSFSSIYENSPILYWKSEKLQPSTASINTAYNEVSLKRYVDRDGELPNEGCLKLNALENTATKLRWYVVNHEVQLLLLDTDYPWKIGHGGAMVDLDQRLSMLKHVAGLSTSPWPDAVVPFLLSIIAGSNRRELDNYSMLVDRMVFWWRAILRERCSRPTVKKTERLKRVMECLPSFAACVITVLHSLILCFDIPSQDIRNLGMFQACMLSPLFALAAADTINIFSPKLTVLNPTDCLNWKRLVNVALTNSKPSVSSISDARWTAIVDMMLGYCIDMVDDTLRFSVGGWFDAIGFLTVMRAKSESIDVLSRVEFRELLYLNDTVAQCIDELLNLEQEFVVSVERYVVQCANAEPAPVASASPVDILGDSLNAISLVSQTTLQPTDASPLNSADRKSVV